MERKLSSREICVGVNCPNYKVLAPDRVHTGENLGERKGGTRRSGVGGENWTAGNVAYRDTPNEFRKPNMLRGWNCVHIGQTGTQTKWW